VFPRPLAGGVILGGSRDDNNWSDEWDEELGQQIMQRCCTLCPELGKPEDLQVISKNIGLRRECSVLEQDRVDMLTRVYI
jgi:D-amino-acid oxidase